MLPEDDYLTRIGRLCYLVTYLEGLILFDLAHLPGPLPPQLDASALAGDTTASLGKKVASRSVLKQISDTATRDWLSRAGALLESTARDRNAVLHARPATIDGQQRLHRWHPQKGDVFTIDQAFLEAAEQRVRDAIGELDRTRVADLKPARQ